MTTLNGMMDMGRRALFANQIALSVIGHNTSNVNTPGYSRQRAELEPSLELPMLLGTLGTGVNAAGIVRIHDDLLERNILQGNTDSSQWEAIDGSLQSLENIFGDVTSGGLSELLTNFWNSWQDVANDPENQSARSELRQNGQSLCSEFNRLHSELTSQRQSHDQEITANVNEINSLTTGIATLNHRISEIENSGGQANDLRDQRTNLLNNLSSLVNIQVADQPDGQINVYLGGQVLIQGDLSSAITTTERSVPNGVVHDLVWADGGTPVVVSGGHIAGLIEMRDQRIPEISGRLNELANALVQQVNALHQTGYDLNGSTGNDFFDPETTGAGDMSLSDGLLASLDTIAASGSGAPGDNSVALSIAGLQNAMVMDNGSSTIGGFYAGLVSEVGSVRQNSTFRYNQEQAALEQLQNQRESVSGVSLDEEMTNLIQYQQAYQAAARLVTTVSQMMDTIVNLA
jgi:flagellar hook-associated protein 1 FlgK